MEWAVRMGDPVKQIPFKTFIIGLVTETDLTKRWVDTWELAGSDLERIRRDELRRLDTFQAISLLCGPADYTRPPFAPRPWSGLVEQQLWFKSLYRHDE